MRLAYYAGASTAAATACLLKAFHQRPNFYSASVYLSQSNACVLILTNLLLVCVVSFMYALQRLLYGPLRPIEIEQLSEKAWYAVLDTLLAMPSFREDVGGWLLAMFVLLLVGKVWGWIGEGRVDILEQQPPANPKLFHARLATSLILSVVFDIYMFNFCVETVLADPRPGMMVIFTFEFAVLAVFSIFTLCRYMLSVAESRVLKKQTQEAIEERKGEIRAERSAARQNETANGTPAPVSSAEEEPIHVDEQEVDAPGWEEKRRYLFILEVVTDFLKLLIYVVFFIISITFNGLPMHIMRDVYMTFAGFSKRVNDYIAYRKATSDMNTRYPDATSEEIRGDACIVCREDMVSWEQPRTAQGQAQSAGEQPAAVPPPTRRRDEGLRAKKLPCGHILHLRCLKAWLERQQVCPTCRGPVVSQTSTATSGQPGAIGADGANGAAPGQPGQNGQGRAQRQNRARIFNLGPIRIGFLNGPGDQIQNIVQQMRNQPGAGQNGANGQQGPNHLGLRVPYAAVPGAVGAAIARPGQAAAGSTSTQVDLMAVEQRLMTEAHNLGIEQQQLAVLRTMEGELARLRANIVPGQQPIGTAMAAQRHISGVPNPLLGQQSFQSMPTYSFQRPSATEILHGHSQQYGSGHESLPQGMALPEGWTVMPLQRTDPITQNVGGPTSQQITGRPMTQQATGQATAVAPHATENGSTSTSQVAPINNEAIAVPTNGSGSPLFAPTVHTAADSEQHALSDATVASSAQQVIQSDSQPANGDPTAPAQTTDIREESVESLDPRPESQARWQASEPAWGLPRQANETVAASEDSSVTQQPDARAESEHTRSSESGDAAPAQSYEGKGKGRAVEIEDAPDPES